MPQVPKGSRGAVLRARTRLMWGLAGSAGLWWLASTAIIVIKHGPAAVFIPIAILATVGLAVLATKIWRSVDRQLLRPPT
jgi:hypothetical protein